MPFDSSGRYTATHRPYDHFGNIIPEIEHSEGIRPAFPFKPAAWLPVKFYDKHFEQWNVIMPGKLVALDPDGRVMPAYYGNGATTIVYTTNDIAAGTIDIRTGVPCVSADTITISTLDGTTSALSFMGRQGEAFYTATARYPIGVAPYAYLQWAGDGSADDDGFNPAALREHNYNMQHQVAVLCDYVIKLPLVPGQVATESMPVNWSAGAITYGTAAWKTRTVARASTERYGTDGFQELLATTNACLLVLANYPVAKNTTRTPITSTLSGLLLNEVDSINAVSVAGDFFVDYKVGVIAVFSNGGSTLPVAGSTITYYHYATAPGVYSVFACVLGTTTELRPGDFLGVAADSNWSLLAMDASTVQAGVMGQVLGFERHPQGGLDRVKTAFNPAIRTNSTGAMSDATLASSSVGLGQMDQMPGSANGGYPDSIHYAGASDTLVIINLIGR
jgi:hypothetical protein